MDSQNPHPPTPDSLAARSSTALRELRERAEAALAARRDQASRLEADIIGQVESIAAALAEQQAFDAASSAEVTEAQSEIKRLSTALEEAQEAAKSERAAWETERVAWDAERKELVDAAARLQAEESSREEQQSTLNELRAQVAQLEQKVSDASAAVDRNAAQWKKERESLRLERDELQQKFELALEDVQRFRGRVAELEQDLARRPAAGTADSAELVALRSERDALAERVAELENAPPVQLDADADEQRADLQRRFEMAVEDVRELKTKNAQLEAQLAEKRPRSGSAPDSGGMDWESQKQRLLASLEGATNDESDPLPEKDRATIEGTIEITDAVVAEKDQIIAELRAELTAAAVNRPVAADAEREKAIDALLDADEVINSHRKKIAQHEQEMEAKLRAAELELSVERATIARQRAELEELRIDLESQRHSQNGMPLGPAAPGTPRRRWLSKLGLTGDDEQ
jgi:chromosome segregation ATPase